MSSTEALHVSQSEVFKLTSTSLSTKKMEAEVSSALRGGSSHDVLSEGFGLRLTRKDLQTLSNLNWLNDEVSPRWVSLVFLWLRMQPQHHHGVFYGSIYGFYVAKSRHAAMFWYPLFTPVVLSAIHSSFLSLASIATFSLSLFLPLLRMFQKLRVGTDVEGRCVSVEGVNLWTRN